MSQQAQPRARTQTHTHTQPEGQGFRLGGGEANEGAFVSPRGIWIIGPLTFDERPVSDPSLRGMEWDRLLRIDGVLARPGAASPFPSSVRLAACPGGFVRLRLRLRENPGAPLDLDIPCSEQWHPDEPWVEMFVANARRAIVDPAHRARFTH